MDMKSNLPLHIVILAAGKGTRMKSSLAKVMHPLAGKPLIRHVLASVNALHPEQVIAILGENMSDVEAAARNECPDTLFRIQHPPQGTGHAVLQAESDLAGKDGITLILFGDTPLITPETLGTLADSIAHDEETVIGVLGMDMDDPAEYGRLIVDEEGRLERIVEFRDANPAERAVTLCNSGVMAVRNSHLFDFLQQVTNDNAKGEYYLTDIVDIARHQGLSCLVTPADPKELAGINSRRQLAEAEAILQTKLRERAMDNGATLVAPETVFLSVDTELGQDCLIQPFVRFGNGVKIGCNVEIRSFSHLEGVTIADDVTVGPYARLRPGTHLHQGARIGNFVEVKNSDIAEGAKINHLSYVGDASVGRNANIGAGTITCNYDGFSKHHTEIGEDVLIGSNTSLVAPVSIGNHAIVGAGSVITEDVPKDSLALTRTEQKTIADKATAIRKKKSA